MEIAIAVYICLWMSFFAIWGYHKIKKDFQEVQIAEQNKESEDAE